MSRVLTKIEEIFNNFEVRILDVFILRLAFINIGFECFKNYKKIKTCAIFRKIV